MPAKSGIYFTIIGIFQFISMAFLIICCVTAPVFKQIGLSKYESITYGVFGYCSDSDGCSKASSDYSPYNLTSDDSSWKLNSNARKTLGSILIIMPIAAGLNFGSFLSSVLSAIFAMINNNHKISAIQFIIDLIFQILAFCSAALMCIVTFLLFYPHITWCSWLLIPAGALPLLSIPLLIMAYLSNNSNNSDEYIDQDELNMTGNQRLLNVEDLYEENPNNNNITSLDRNVVLPDIEKKTDSFTFTTRSDSDDSTNSDKQGYNIYQNENPSNSADNVVNDDEDEQDSKLQQRFSVIESDTDDQNNKIHRYIPSDSLGSSVYSEKDHYSEIQPKNQDSIMQDFMNHANRHDTITERDEEGSVITSVSRNGPNKLAPPPSMPYPASNASVNQNNNNNPNMNMNRQRNFPQQHQNMPMNMNYMPQQQYYMPPPQQQMPTASEMIMQNNPNFLPNGSNRMNPRMQRQQNPNFNNRNMMMMNQQNNVAGGNTHFAPAYKRRINNRANVYQNINGPNNGFGPASYNFR